MSHLSTFFRWCTGFLSIMVMAIQIPVQAQSGINEYGSFEQQLPSYWTKGAEPSGSTLSWATDQFRSMGKSLKITKTATSEAAMWKSENMVDNWSPQHLPNIDIKVGAYVKTANVNTNPANDDERWWISYTFYNRLGNLIGETKLPIDQSTATSSGWIADTNGVGETILPDSSWNTIISFVGGKNATGTVWADDFLLYARGSQPWLAGQNWNTQVGVPTGWFYWLPPNGGNDGLLSDGYENTKVTNEEAYQGLYSLKFDNLPGTHDGFVGTRKYPLSGVVPGDIIRISVWIKGMNLKPDSAAAVGDAWSVAITPIFHNTIGNNAGWGEFWASDIPLKFPNATSFDWKQFYVDVPVQNGAVSLSVRLHPLGRFQGTVYLDQLTVEKLDLPEISAIGSFEQQLPSYWTKGAEPSGSTLSWATDQFRSMGKSLKITKTATSEAAMWKSENMVDNWSPQHLPNIDIKVGAYVKTANVNTNPANDDERWWISYTFYNRLGNLIGETKLPIDQSTATSSGWIADTNGVGETILPDSSWNTIISFVGGKNATGTVWADDFLLYARGSQPWLAGQNWNTQVGVPTGWFYWLPPNGGNDGLLSDGYENTKVTNEEAYQGLYSLKFDNLPGTHDGFVGTRKYPLNSEPPLGQSRSMNESQDITALNGVVPGDIIRISVWIKGMNLKPDSAAAVGDAWSVAITPIFHNTIGNNAGWGEFWASDIPLKFPNATSFDWKQFYVDVPVQNGAVSLSVRLHPLGRFQGTVYLDQLTVEKLDLPEISAIGSFEQQLPSYWTKGAEPSGSTLSWATDQFRSMGKSLKITKTATSEAAMWKSENMVDNWSPQHLPNIDIKVGAYVKTANVNTNPANDDERWWISYTFYNRLGNLIGETKLPIDQSTATSSGWIADTNGVGETILPDSSWNTIISFVGGKNATGTVWADDFLLYARGSQPWLAGQNWNTQVGVPTGWFYWLPPNGGNDGLLSDGYENTKVTNEEAYQGLYSLKFDNLPGTHDGFVGTRKYPLNSEPPLGQSRSMNESQDITALNGVVPGDIIRISVWIKGMNLKPDSAAAVGDAWSVAITPIFHNTIGNNAGWGEFWASDIPLKFPNATSFDWKQFYVDVPVQNGAVSLSVRLHPLGRFQGTVYMDQLQIKKNGVTDITAEAGTPTNFSLSQNYPNPFNPSTVINYSLPTNSFVTLTIYDVLGREVKTLVNNEQNSGTYNVQWSGENNYGSKVSSGLYIYTIRSGQFNESRKMVLLK